MVFDIPERRMARRHRFDVRSADGKWLELSAETAEDKRSWLQALCAVVVSAGLQQHPRAKEFSRTRPGDWRIVAMMLIGHFVIMGCVFKPPGAGAGASATHG